MRRAGFNVRLRSFQREARRAYPLYISYARAQHGRLKTPAERPRVPFSLISGFPVFITLIIEQVNLLL